MSFSQNKKTHHQSLAKQIIKYNNLSINQPDNVSELQLSFQILNLISKTFNSPAPPPVAVTNSTDNQLISLFLTHAHKQN